MTSGNCDCAAQCLGLVTVIVEKGVLKSMSRLNHCVRAAAPKAVLRLGSDYWYAKVSDYTCTHILSILVNAVCFGFHKPAERLQLLLMYFDVTILNYEI